jgi:hypothetical protein
MRKMTTKTRRTRKPTSGSSSGAGFRRWVTIAFLVTLLSPAAFPEKKEKPKPAAAPYALIAGSVFRPPGFALPGAQVVFTPEQPQANGIKLKKLEAVGNFRGEFAVRVPAVPSKWRVDVKMNGYRPDQKSVSVEGEQRFDLSFVLEPARNSPEKDASAKEPKETQ